MTETHDPFSHPWSDYKYDLLWRPRYGRILWLDDEEEDLVKFVRRPSFKSWLPWHGMWPASLQ